MKEKLSREFSTFSDEDRVKRKSRLDSLLSEENFSKLNVFSGVNNFEIKRFLERFSWVEVN